MFCPPSEAKKRCQLTHYDKITNLSKKSWKGLHSQNEDEIEIPKQKVFWICIYIYIYIYISRKKEKRKQIIDELRLV